MGEPPRKLNLVGTGIGELRKGASGCPVTGLTIPECSCRRCAEAQIKAHAPWLLERGPHGRGHGSAA